MKPGKILTGSDRRPRIHIWPKREGADFSLGPCGTRFGERTIGAAVETALAAVDHAPAVIIFEGGSASRLLAEHMGAARD